MAEIVHANDNNDDTNVDDAASDRKNTRSVQFKMSDVPESNKLEKFVEDVRLILYDKLIT